MGMSVGESDAGILASDFCDAPTDSTLLVDNIWQPLPAAKQRETDTLTCCCWHRLFTFSKRAWSTFLSNKHVILERKKGEIVAGDL